MDIITRTLVNIDTKERHEISVDVVACAGGFTYQIFADTPTAVFASADAAADAYAVDAQRRYERQIISERGRPALPYRCKECGVSFDRPYCPNCRDPEMIVDTRTNKSETAPFGTDGLNEDHYGHG